MIRIGVDIDSVICNIEDGMLEYIQKNWHPNFQYEDFVDFKVRQNPHLGVECAEALIQVATSAEFLARGTMYPGSREALFALNIHADVHLVTGRYEYELRDTTLTWLQDRVLPFAKIHFTNMSNKLDIISKYNLKAFVEDNPYEIEGILNQFGSLPYGIYCVDRPWNKSLKDKRVSRVGSLREASNLIINRVGG